jgi:prepilin-type N-terminal cleavage/methylation domain-containing protein
MKGRGMTLLEAMVVVSIVGMLSAMAGLSFFRLRSIGRSREATRLVLSYLRDARLRAVTSGVPHGVYISTIPDPVFGLGPGSPAGQMLLYRKPTPVAPNAFFEPATDIEVTRSPILDRGQSVGRAGAPVPGVEAGQIGVLELTFDAGGGYAPLNNGEALQVSYDADGRPTIHHLAAGQNDLTAIVQASAQRRFVIRLRDARDDNPAGLLGMPNASSRCAEVLITGTTRSLSRDGLRQECL